MQISNTRFETMYNAACEAGRIWFVIFTFLISAAFQAKGQIYVGGEITGNETYSPTNNPYIVTQDLIVDNDVTLTLLPGVEMQFESGTSLIVNGILIAKGTQDMKIKFVPKNQSYLHGQWNGIKFYNAKTILGADSTYISGSVLSHTLISNASYSITLEYKSSLLIENTEVKLCSFGIYVKESKFNTFRNNVFSGCDFGIFLANGFQNPGNIITSNLITGCNDVGIFINSLAAESNHNVITGNRIISCNIGMHIGNYSNNGEAFNVISGNTFLGNKDAVKLFQHSNQVSSNYFIMNRSGIICWQSDKNTIIHNLFSRNVQNAITLAGGSSFNSISFNSMNFNTGAVRIKSDSARNSVFNSLLYNTMCGNTGFSVEILANPQGPVQFSNIFQNSPFQSFRNLSDSIIHAEYNFWGSSSVGCIDSILLDQSDEPLYGVIKYLPALGNMITTAPVPPPDRVIKQNIRNNIVLSWKLPNLADLVGFNVYYGMSNGFVFDNKVDNGMKTSLNLGTISVEDTVAVTAYDFLADGHEDQTEGSESDFSFAILYPYAGPDTSVCFNAAYALTEANAYNYENIHWYTSGDGSFNFPGFANPVYTPGVQDYINGFVYLFIDDGNPGFPHIDTALITFHDGPGVFAGNDTLVNSIAGLSLHDATASGYDIVRWYTSGDGTFNSDTLLNPVYLPGPGDITSGSVTLTAAAFSNCGSASDELIITIDPGYSIEGRVHAGSGLAANSRIELFQEKGSQVLPFRAGILTTDGNFKFNALPAGDYYLYAIPDKLYYPGYLPTYFFNDLHWENAYKIGLHENTYDVDIDLSRSTVQLQPGEGSILGYCTSKPGNSVGCGDVTVLLYDNLMKNVLDWEPVENGSDFRFRNLPFGSYKLACEKAGKQVFISDAITLLPSHPKIENIELLCLEEGYRFSLPSDFSNKGEHDGPGVFPNPVEDVLTITGLDEPGTYLILLSNSQGSVKKYCLDGEGLKNKLLFLPSLPSGLYIIEVWKDNNCLLRQKLIKTE